ncbi:uncharacterized protein LOC123630371 [Lemur catta]|uniref:uncharacterized protein LOC123630371 n=1 Tax=Lemur catta TaxID=9447 RepID=UPI001E268F84|nr:uncharacterized protein LOC123630371 [Lemur catta]
MTDPLTAQMEALGQQELEEAPAASLSPRKPLRSKKAQKTWKRRTALSASPGFSSRTTVVKPVPPNRCSWRPEKAPREGRNATRRTRECARGRKSPRVWSHRSSDCLLGISRPAPRSASGCPPASWLPRGDDRPPGRGGAGAGGRPEDALPAELSLRSRGRPQTVPRARPPKAEGSRGASAAADLQPCAGTPKAALGSRSNALGARPSPAAAGTSELPNAPAEAPAEANQYLARVALELLSFKVAIGIVKGGLILSSHWTWDLAESLQVP